MDVELAATPRGDVEAVLAMYEAKTSVYSFCAPLQAGAVLAGAGPAVVAALRRAGLAVGVAFQIADDLLGTFGDAGTTGKSVASDAREGKQTVLAALLAAADPAAADRFRREAGTDDDAFAQAYRDAIERSGARDAAAGLVVARTADARAHLEAVPTALRAAVEAVLDDLHERVA
jgi:geranylgeranyl diphosphate synthase type II